MLLKCQSTFKFLCIQTLQFHNLPNSCTIQTQHKSLQTRHIQFQHPQLTHHPNVYIISKYCAYFCFGGDFSVYRIFSNSSTWVFMVHGFQLEHKRFRAWVSNRTIIRENAVNVIITQKPSIVFYFCRNVREESLVPLYACLARAYQRSVASLRHKI